MNTKPKGEVAFIVGRFQEDKLHEGHRELIQSVVEQHPKTFIILGLAPFQGTINNPLDFEMRKQMLLAEFPDINVLYIKDVRDDAIWSANLDRIIKDMLAPKQTAVLYGSRDSFIPHYSGRYPVTELVPKRIFSATEIRNNISKKVKATPDFRAGVIHATGNRWPACIPTVDIAILKGDEILLIKKEGEKEYRFVGGIAEPKSESFEQDARREVMEETGLEVGDMEYLGSAKINDWRFEGEVDGIKTLFFKADYIFGAPQVQDKTEGIEELRWFKLEELTEKEVIFEHRVLVKLLLEKLNK